MKKLFNLKDCSETEPSYPGDGYDAGGDSHIGSDDWSNYYNDWSSWFNGCLAELGTIPPPNPPNINNDPNKFEDNKGYIWTRTISTKGVDFKLDFFDNPMQLESLSLSNSDGLLIIAIRVSLTNYSILTLSSEGIKMQTIKRHKVRFANLLGLISNHTKIPNVDFNEAAKKVLVNQ